MYIEVMMALYLKRAWEEEGDWRWFVLRFDRMVHFIHPAEC